MLPQANIGGMHAPPAGRKSPGCLRTNAYPMIGPRSECAPTSDLANLARKSAVFLDPMAAFLLRDLQHPPKSQSAIFGRGCPKLEVGKPYNERGPQKLEMPMVTPDRSIAAAHLRSRCRANSDNDCPPDRALDIHRNHCPGLLRLALAHPRYVISGQLAQLFAPSARPLSNENGCSASMINFGVSGRPIAP